MWEPTANTKMSVVQAKAECKFERRKAAASAGTDKGPVLRWHFMKLRFLILACWTRGLPQEE